MSEPNPKFWLHRKRSAIRPDELSLRIIGQYSGSLYVERKLPPGLNAFIIN